jgi:rod shape-determining protein MreD
MLQKIFIFSVIFLAAVIQTSVLTIFITGRYVPSVLLIIVVFLSARRGFEKVLAVSVVSGIILDILSFWPIGTSVFIFVLVSFIAGSLSKRLLVQDEAWSFFLIMGILIGAVLFQEAVLFFVSKVLTYISSTGAMRPVSSNDPRNILKEILGNLALFAMLNFILKKIDRIFFGPLRSIYLIR